MRAKVKLPQWGMSMVEGTVAKWLKGEGDRVEAGEPLVEIEIEKAVNELNAPIGGTLTKIIVQQGETVPVQEVLCEIET
jgi:pyruvate dehydrogenase E2 component (dihydrolipoyllysine-residue acetyltransferase)